MTGTYPPGRIRWVLRLLGWNALLLFAGVVLIAMAEEAYLRLTVPFMTPIEPWEFVPNVGNLRPPNTEIRSTNRLDFWNVSRTNSLGFLDREPPTPERAAATCHISIIGDSFVEAREVPIHDKFQVRLEALAADELPHLKITTSAFGIAHTGQVQQLPFYDEYARLLHPKLLVLVFIPNDFKNNMQVQRAFTSRKRVWLSRSYLALWLHKKKRLFALSRHKVVPVSARKDLLLIFEDALQYTRFAMEQFKQRADRDGAKLVILASFAVKGRGIPMFERLSKIAAALDIPVIDQGDYILRQGNKFTDAHWPNDFHWNPAGHRWAAEALLEYIKQHPAICDGPT